MPRKCLALTLMLLVVSVARNSGERRLTAIMRIRGFFDTNPTPAPLSTANLSLILVSAYCWPMSIRGKGYNLILPAGYAGPNYIYAISIAPSASASLVTYKSNLNPPSTCPELPAPVLASTLLTARKHSNIATTGGIPAESNTSETLHCPVALIPGAIAVASDSQIFVLIPYGSHDGTGGQQATLACSADACRVNSCSQTRHSRTF
jgi:hypothetical protein